MNVKVQLIGVLVLLVSILPGEPAVSAERIVIGTPSRGLFEFPAVVAMRKGYYKDEGLDVDKVQMQPAIAVKALISGISITCWRGGRRYVRRSLAFRLKRWSGWPRDRCTF